MTETDKSVVISLLNEIQQACRILVTGEAAIETLGDVNQGWLHASNMTLAEEYGKDPLFAVTREGTIRMLRYDPAVIWEMVRGLRSATEMEVMRQCLVDEQDRLNIPFDIQFDWPDFYEAMVKTIRLEVEKKTGSTYCVPVFKAGSDSILTQSDVFYHFIYLSSLLLFNKPDYMAVPVSRHFALADAEEFMSGAIYRELTRAEINQLERLALRYEGIEGLTSTELEFLIGLYDTDVAAGITTGDVEAAKANPVVEGHVIVQDDVPRRHEQ
jgi:hypothetical protein